MITSLLPFSCDLLKDLCHSLNHGFKFRYLVPGLPPLKKNCETSLLVVYNSVLRLQ